MLQTILLFVKKKILSFIKWVLSICIHCLTPSFIILYYCFEGTNANEPKATNPKQLLKKYKAKHPDLPENYQSCMQFLRTMAQAGMYVKRIFFLYFNLNELFLKAMQPNDII